MKNKISHNRKGYTLIELLVVIAIIVVLLGLTMISGSSVLASMKQNKLDTIAQDIYVTAQARLTEIYADSRAEYLDYDLVGSTVGMYKLTDSNKPSDWNNSLNYEGLNAFYNKAASDVAVILLPAGTLSEEVNENHWIIEYNATYGYIYGVYYSEKAFSPSDISTWYSSGTADKYRVFADRKGSGVGYYGGYGVNGHKVEMTATALNLTMNLTNAEELKLDLAVAVPTEYKTRPVRLKFIVTGETSQVTNTISSDVLTYTSYGYFKRQISYVLDSFNLKNGSSQQFERNSWFAGMEPGENVTIKVVAEIGVDGAGAFVADTMLDTAETTITFNSLFDSYDAETKTAYISAGRHLQNLTNISSRVDVQNVVQISNIDFENTTPDVSNDAIYWWAETYPNRAFEPIRNGNIISFTGSSAVSGTTENYIINGMTIDATGLSFAGMFDVLGRDGSTVTIKDVSLVGTKTTKAVAENVGALAGKSVGTVILQNTGAYLARDDYSNVTYSTATTALSGNTVGGLVGWVAGDVTATECYAAEILRGASFTGGLFGKVDGKMSLTKSYADCYMIANSGNVGGLAGACGDTSTISGCYTAGYTIGVPAQSAGFVPSTVASISNSYSVLNIGPNNESGSGNSVGITTKFYTTVGGGTIGSDVYFALPEGVVYDTSNANRYVELGTKRTFSQLRSANAQKATITSLSATNYKFGTVAGDTTSYNLAAGLGLTNYPYPFIIKADGTVLHHYGDWDGNLFDPGTLVYFEQYTDGTRGYYGAGSNFLDSDKEIAFDGYTLLYSSDSVTTAPYYGTTSQATVTYGGQSYTINTINTSNDKYKVTKRSITGDPVEAYYYFRDLPSGVINSASAATSAFYTYIKVETPDTVDDDNQGVSHYYFNPHFAATVQQVETATSAAPTLASAAKNIVRIRTPRQLYLLSTYFTNGDAGHYGSLTSRVTIEQEKDLDYSKYNWSRAGFSDAVDTQRPIADGSGARQFNATYDGNSNIITGVNFMSDTLYSGMFGVIGNTGKVTNVAIVADVTVTGNTVSGYQVGFNTDPQSRNNYAYIGVLAGNNQGIISNCAVAGYTIDTNCYYTTLYAGGLVGFNNRTINNSAADTPKITVRANACNAYIGSFTGSNGGNGFVNACYAISDLNVSSYISGTVRVAGFSGSNAGTIKNTYTVTAMTLSSVDENNVDAFTFVGGSVQSSYFLTGGTYKYVNGVNAYNQTTKTSAIAANNVSEMPGGGTVALDGFGSVEASTTKYHANTSSAAGNVYPFAAVVKTAGGQFVHYGDWISDDVLGNVGIVYWEHEVGGTNEGYHFYTLNENDKEVTTLCESHDDGGVITEYGYGYFKLTAEKDNISTPVFGNVNSASDLANYVNENASKDLAKQFANCYEFVLYDTKDAFTDVVDGMCLTGSNAYATATIAAYSIGEKSYAAKNYVYSPFFGATLEVGTSAPQTMQVRSINQLQFLNWNQDKYETQQVVTNKKQIPSNTDLSTLYNNNTKCYYAVNDRLYAVTITKAADRYTVRYVDDNGASHDILTNRGNHSLAYYPITLYTADSVKDEQVYKSGNTKELVNASNYKTFTYLGQASVTNRGSQSKNAANNKVVFDWSWVQSHDIKLSSSVSTGFTPIAGAATSSSSSSYTAILYAWFGSEYNGQSYKIEDVNISSDAFTVGLFGVTAGANMHNIIMYSENNAVIERKTEANSTPGAYSLGGMVGVVYDYQGETAELTNCAIAGYRIVDNSKNQQTVGEANVGGLVGVCNGNLVKCSAVTSIEINCTHRGTTGTGYTQATYGNYIRVGGLTGATLNKLTDCYTGGSISVGDATLLENINGSGTFVASNSASYVQANGSSNTSTSIYVAGIGGSGFAQNYMNFSNQNGLREGNPSFENCYTYIDLPKLEGTIRSISIIGSVADRYGQATKVTIKNCYYLDSIVDMDEMLSNVPNFYYNNNVKNIKSTLTANNGQYFTEMLKGSSVYVNKVIHNTDTGRYDTIELTALTMEQLGTTKLLGTAWANVDTTENGAIINGKYSFPGSDHQLDGRNYPFPAVVTQISDATGDTVHVHYGSWPKGTGLFSSESTMELDLLTKDKDSKTVVLTNYTDYKVTPIDITKLSFTFSEIGEDGTVKTGLTKSEIIKVEATKDETKGTVDLKVTGLKEGSATISAVYDDNGTSKIADIQVTVFADYSVKATLVKVETDATGKITKITEVENPAAIPTAFQQENLYWKLTGTAANGEPLTLFANNWKVEETTVDENYDVSSIFQVEKTDGSGDYDVLLKFNSLLVDMHNIQVTCQNVEGVSGQSLTGSRSVELQLKVLQNPPTVTVWRYPQDAVTNEQVKLTGDVSTIYQISNNGTISYAYDKAGETSCVSLPHNVTETGYTTFLGYVLADSAHEVTNNGVVSIEYVMFTDADGKIVYTGEINNYQRNLNVYGLWTTSQYSITYDTGYTTVTVPDTAQKTYTIAKEITLPNVEGTTDGKVTDGEREYVFTGWKLTGTVDSSWDASVTYQADQTIAKGKTGDVTFTAVWSPVCNITYFKAGGTEQYASTGFDTYVGNSSTISLFTPDAADAPEQNQVFIGWKVKTLGTAQGWTVGTIYKNPVSNATSFTGDIELEAVWGTTYDIVYRVNPNDTTQDVTDAYTVGYSFIIKEAIDAPDGYLFVNWKVVEAEQDSGWTVGTTYSAGAQVDNTSATYKGRVVLEPVFEYGQYTITYKLQDGDTVFKTVDYMYTDSFTIESAPERDEHDFITWKASDDGSWAGREFRAGQTVTNQYGNVTLTAQWAEKTYYVVYNVNGGQMPKDENGEKLGWIETTDNKQVTAYKYSTGVTLVAPTKTGYEFKGWQQKTGQTNVADNESWSTALYLAGSYTGKKGDVYMDAQWDAKEYTITYVDTNDQVIGTQKYKTTDTDKTVAALPTSTVNGYQNVCWTLTQSNAVECNWTSTVNAGTTLEGLYGDVTLKCTSAAINYTITYVYQDTSGTVSQQVDYNVADSITIMSLPAVTAGYTNSWSVETATGETSNWNATIVANALANNIQLTGMYGNVTLKCVETPKEYTIKYVDQSGNAIVDSNGQAIEKKYKITESVTIEKLPTEIGYTYSGWSVAKVNAAECNWSDSVVANTNIEAGLYGDVILTCTRVAITYKISYKDVDGNVIKDTGGQPIVTEYDIDHPVTVQSITAIPGYDTYWIIDAKDTRGCNWNDESVQSGATLNGRYGDITLKIKKTPKSYTITYIDYDGSTSTATYKTGETVTITGKDTPKGYTYTSWTVTPNSTENNWSMATVEAGSQITNEMYGDVTLKRSRTIDTYWITYLDPNGNQIGQKVSYTVETDVTLASAPTHQNAPGDNKAYFFTEWSVVTNGDKWVGTYSADLNRGKGLYGDVSLKAEFVTRKLTLHANSAGSVIDYYLKINATNTTFNGYFTTNYSAPTRTGWTLDGWYTADGVKVLNADGTVASNKAGITANSAFDLTEDQVLYAKWKRTRTLLVPLTDLSNLNGKTVAIGIVSGEQLKLISDTDNLDVWAVVLSTYDLNTVTIPASNAVENGMYVIDGLSVDKAMWGVTKNGNKNEYQFESDHFLYFKTTSNDITSATSATNWSINSESAGFTLSYKYRGTTYYLRQYNDGDYRRESNNSNASIVRFYEKETRNETEDD